MRKRTYVIVLVTAALLILAALALRGDGAQAVAGWLRSMHGH